MSVRFSNRFMSVTVDGDSFFNAVINLYRGTGESAIRYVYNNILFRVETVY